jgi:hypothetical protein
MVVDNKKDVFLNSKDVFTTNYSAHFDEGGLLSRMQENAQIKVYHNVDCADILYTHFEFHAKELNQIRQVLYFVKNANKIEGLYYENGKIEKKEYAYLHLQKRRMSITANMKLNHYCIVPNSFISIEGLNPNPLVYSKRDEEYENAERLNIRKRQVENIKKGAILFRFKRIVSGINQWLQK